MAMYMQLQRLAKISAQLLAWFSTKWKRRNSYWSRHWTTQIWTRAIMCLAMLVDRTWGINTTLKHKSLALTAVFDVKVGADFILCQHARLMDQAKFTATVWPEEWVPNLKRNVMGCWIFTYKLAVKVQQEVSVAPVVIDNGDGTYRANDIKINSENYWMSVSRNAPSMFIYDNSYVKCREITLSYQFPQKWFGKVVQDVSFSSLPAIRSLYGKIFPISSHSAGCNFSIRHRIC